MTNLPWVSKALEQRKREHLYRSTQARPEIGPYLTEGDRRLINLSGNDYLNLAGSSSMARAAIQGIDQAGCGATASRLVIGSLDLHEALERRLAETKQCEAALLFGSGYLTSIGTIPALVDRHDVILIDRLAHACMVDGAVLSRATMKRFKHNDMAHLETLLQASQDAPRRLICTESVFSMDGDLAPLQQLADLADQYNAMLMVDEAHATGVFGPMGSGRSVELGLSDRIHVCMGTLSKGLGGYGGFIAGSHELIDLLKNTARSFIYTTALPPAVISASLGALDYLKQHPDTGQEVLIKAKAFREELQAAGIDCGASQSQIVPVMVGDNQLTLDIAEALKERGVLAIAIRPPTVPDGTARIRCSITHGHDPVDLSDAAAHIIQEFKDRKRV